MKVNVSNEMKSRLTHAAANGSVIAGDILMELRKNCDVSEIIRGSYNCFSTKRKRTSCSSYQKVRIVFTACNKDLRNENFPDKGNPNAPWFPGNRTDLEPSTFAGLFKNLPEYSSEDIRYFASAISLDSKVSIKVCSSMNDFIGAYDETNYSMTADTDQSTLHNSCMRYEGRARNAADFYTNFAGAKIMVAKDNRNNIVGRAVVWEGLWWEKTDGRTAGISLMDRIYVSHTFVADLMRQEAKNCGITLRKAHNDFAHPTECVVMNPVEGVSVGDELSFRLSLDVPACRWHKKGVPYMDTFLYVCLDGGQLVLRNHSTSSVIAGCQHTDGCAGRSRQVCPRCNKLHLSGDRKFCGECYPQMYTETAFGTVLNGPAVRYRGANYPSQLFRKGKPIPEFSRYLQIERLYNA